MSKDMRIRTLISETKIYNQAKINKKPLQLERLIQEIGLKRPQCVG
jgi:hypothetical protein